MYQFGLVEARYMELKYQNEQTNRYAWKKYAIFTKHDH